MNRPPLERFERIAQRGIQMEIPQAADMLVAVQYALVLESALKFVRDWFDHLDNGCPPDDDPLTELRKVFHAPVHAAIDAALGPEPGTANGADGREPNPAGGKENA